MNAAPTLTGPTPEERAAIEAGIHAWETSNASPADGHPVVEVVSRHPAVIAGAKAHRAWTRRTCPSWCTCNHDDLLVVARLATSHSHHVATLSPATGPDVHVTVFSDYDEEILPEERLELPMTISFNAADEFIWLTADQARDLATHLQVAASILDAAQSD